MAQGQRGQLSCLCHLQLKRPWGSGTAEAGSRLSGQQLMGRPTEPGSPPGSQAHALGPHSAPPPASELPSQGQQGHGLVVLGTKPGAQALHGSTAVILLHLLRVSPPAEAQP